MKRPWKSLPSERRQYACRYSWEDQLDISKDHKQDNHLVYRRNGNNRFMQCRCTLFVEDKHGVGGRTKHVVLRLGGVLGCVLRTCHEITLGFDICSQAPSEALARNRQIPSSFAGSFFPYRSLLFLL